MTTEQIQKEKTELVNKKNPTALEWFTIQLMVQSNKTQLITALRSIRMLNKQAYKEDTQKLGLKEIETAITTALTLNGNEVENR